MALNPLFLVPKFVNLAELGPAFFCKDRLIQEYNFLIKKTCFYWFVKHYTLKYCQEIGNGLIFFFKISRFLNRWASWAKPSWFSKLSKLSSVLSQAFCKEGWAEPNQAFLPKNSNKNQAKPNWALVNSLSNKHCWTKVTLNKRNLSFKSY